MNTLDIKKIMAEVEVEVARRRFANKYRHDLKLLEEFGRIEAKDSTLYDLKMQSYHTKTIQLPKSLKAGIISKISNKLILKLYFVIGKMFDDSLRIQQKINTKLIDEVIEIKKKLSIVDLDHFPYAEFRKTFAIPLEIYIATFEVCNKFISDHSRIVELNAQSPLFLNKLVEIEGSEITAINKNPQEISQMDVNEKVIVEHRELFEFLSNSGIEYYDVIILQDTVEYLSLNYFITLLKEVNRALSKRGKLIIRTLDPSQIEVIENTFDPKIQKLIHPYLMKFLLDYYNFEIIELLENQAGLEKYYVAIAQKK